MKWLLIAGLLAGTTPALAQAGLAIKARITTATEGGKVRRFQVPQVQLASATAASRINRRIVRLMLGQEVDSPLSVSRQLQQAERNCCYDTENGLGWNTVGQGLTGCEYKVLLNAQGLLSLEYYQEFTGAYSWQRTQHATFNLQTGQEVSLTDLVAEPLPRLTRRLQGAINRRLGEWLAEAQSEYDDSAVVNDLAERFCWDWKTKQVRFQPAAGASSSEELASAPDLTDFALTPTALLLFYEPYLPHVMLDFEPDATYRFPYGRLQTKAPLMPLQAKGIPIKK